MTRVLLEHLAVHRPHPWGVMVTFIELLRNPKYEFWSYDFIHVTPEISLIMENVRLIFPFVSKMTNSFRLQVAKNIQS